jgi:hypothetical protein
VAHALHQLAQVRPSRGDQEIPGVAQVVKVNAAQACSGQRGSQMLRRKVLCLSGWPRVANASASDSGAGQADRAHETLTEALNNAATEDEKQCSVIVGDLAAVAAAQKKPEDACRYAEQALGVLPTDVGDGDTDG